MLSGKNKFVALILILAFSINMISVQCFAADTRGKEILTADGFKFDTVTGTITGCYNPSMSGNIEIPREINGIKVIAIAY